MASAPGERDAGVGGDRDVDPAEVARRCRRRRAAERVHVGHVGLEHLRALAQAGSERLQALGLQTDERDVRALGVQPLCGRGADAARGARDEDGPPAARQTLDLGRASGSYGVPFSSRRLAYEAVSGRRRGLICWPAVDGTGGSGGGPGTRRLSK